LVALGRKTSPKKRIREKVEHAIPGDGEGQGDIAKGNLAITSIEI